MGEKIVTNKQIPIETILEVARHLCEYEKKNHLWIDEKKKENDEQIEKDYKNAGHFYGSTDISYKIRFLNGKTLEENKYEWFETNLKNEIKNIESIHISMDVYYRESSILQKYGNENDRKDIDVSFSIINNCYEYKRDKSVNKYYSDVLVSVRGENNDSEVHEMYMQIKNMLNNNEDRYNRTIKNRNLRIQSFCITIGMILSYIVFVLALIFKSKLPGSIANNLTNRYVVTLCQWIVAILLGNLTSSWYMTMLYRKLLPSQSSDYSAKSHKIIYKDKVDEYMGENEAHFGQFHDAGIRRKKIEKIYKVTRICVLVQLIISIMLFLILK